MKMIYSNNEQTEIYHINMYKYYKHVLRNLCWLQNVILQGEPGSAVSGGGLPGRKGEPGIPGIPVQNKLMSNTGKICTFRKKGIGDICLILKCMYSGYSRSTRQWRGQRISRSFRDTRSGWSPGYTGSSGSFHQGLSTMLSVC